MKVLVVPADTGGCGNYRLIFAAEHLRSEGYDIEIQYPGTSSGFNVHFLDSGEMTDFELPDGVDVLVMQRISHEWHIQAIPLLRRKGIATVIDMDDDLSTIHRNNVAYWNYSPRNKNTPFSYKNAQGICRSSTYVTVSTPYLMGVYAAHNPGQILRNYVPERYLHIDEPPLDTPVFGWAGTLQSHPEDLGVTGKAIKDLTDSGHKFSVVGPGAGIAKKLGLKENPEATGPVSLFEYPTEISRFAVGIAPLEPSAFNRAKSHLKPLEYNAVGVPYVVSPRDEYRWYHRQAQGGLLAETGRDWVKAVSALMTNESQRKELAEAGRAFAATQTIETNAWRFWEAWTTAYDLQRKGRSE